MLITNKEPRKASYCIVYNLYCFYGIGAIPLIFKKLLFVGTRN